MLAQSAVGRIGIVEEGAVDALQVEGAGESGVGFGAFGMVGHRSDPTPALATMPRHSRAVLRAGVSGLLVSPRGRGGAWRRRRLALCYCVAPSAPRARHFGPSLFAIRARVVRGPRLRLGRLTMRALLLAQVSTVDARISVVAKAPHGEVVAAGDPRTTRGDEPRHTLANGSRRRLCRGRKETGGTVHEADELRPGRLAFSRPGQRGIRSAVTGEVVATAASGGARVRAPCLDHARDVGGPGAAPLTFHERAALLKTLAGASDGAQGRVLPLSLHPAARAPTA